MPALQITGRTRLGGLLGSPVAHSISPLMHNFSFQALGIDYVYLCFDIGPERLSSTVSALRDMNTYGFNLTMPDKEAVLPYLDYLSDTARLMGAVNTVVCSDGKLYGHNTDGAGFFRSAQENNADPTGKEMTLLGCGGAANAIAVYAAQNGVQKLHLACRRSASWTRAQSLVDTLNRETPCVVDLIDLYDISQLRPTLQDSSLLVNATSVGMEPHAENTPVSDPSLFHDDLVVADVIYHPRKTRLLAMAEDAGCRIFNGMYMLLYQGAEAFRLWTGQDMPVEQVKRVIY